MKKILISSLLLVISSLNAFEFSDLTSSIQEVTTSVFKNNSSTTIIDTECKNAMDNYQNNYMEAIKLAGVYAASNSSSFMNLITDKHSDGEETGDNLKLLAKEISKKTVWLPVEIEKEYGQYIYKNRLEKGDVVLRSTKNRKYKKMYKKLDIFVKEYNDYLKTNDYLKDNSYPFKIKIFILSTKNKVEAIPGGYIFISEDFLKGKRYETALAHELTHISKRHLTKDLQYRLISGYDDFTDMIKFIKKINQKKDAIATSLVYTNFIFKNFEKHTQDQELEADACSLKILTTINKKRKEYYVQQLIKNIDITLQDKQETSDKEIFSFSEHPSKELRIKNINRLSKKL